MQPLFIRLNQQPCTVKIKVEAFNAAIRIMGADYERENTKYFDRGVGMKKTVTGILELEFPLPVSPVLLKVYIVNLSSSENSRIKVLDIKLDYLNTLDLVITKKSRDFMEFAIDFAVAAGENQPGVYESEDGKYILGYSNYIRNRKTGKIMDTPARVSRISGIIECNRLKFLKYTIPMRILILMHEWMHYERNTKQEIEADLNALRIYLSYGFPQTEAIYATTYLFHNTDPMKARVQEIMDFIHDFDVKRKHKERRAVA